MSKKTKKYTLNPFWGNVFKSLSGEGKSVDSKLLGKIPIFKNLTKRELKTVSEILYDRKYEAGESIFLMNQPGAAMFIIKSGAVQICLERPDDTQIVLAELEEGNFFGEIALLENSPRSASAYAMSNTELMAVFRSDLDKLVSKEPLIAAKMMKQLAVVIGVRLKATNKMLNEGSITDEERG